MLVITTTMMRHETWVTDQTCEQDAVDRITSLLSVHPPLGGSGAPRANRDQSGADNLCRASLGRLLGKRSAMMPKNFEGFLVHRFLRLELHVKNTSRQTRVSGIFFSKWQQPFNATSPPNASATTIIASSITITTWSRKP